MALEPRCPFCWDKNVICLGPPLKCPGERHPSQLMECRDCEKWYWEGTGVEVPRLFEICATAVVSPSRCCREIREVVGSGGSKWPRRRSSEFNGLCSECPHARFVARGIGDESGTVPVSLC